MTALAQLTAETRTGQGKGVARELRRNAKIPAVLYGKGVTPTSLALSLNEVTLQYRKGRFTSRLLELKLDGKAVKALPHEVQFHPVTDQIEHVDFIKVDGSTEIRVKVPVKFLNSEKSVGIKRGGVLNVVRHDIEFLCKADSIPTTIEINIADKDIGDSIHINDVTLPSGVKPTIKRNFTIATIAGRSAADEAEAAPAAAAAATPAAAAAPAADAKKK
jgi:large subunit ribosomal protein L25